MKRNWMIVGLTVVVVLAVVSFIISLHSSSKKEVLSRYQEHQLLHAEYLANQIESFLWGQSRGLQALPSYVPSDYDVLKQTKVDIQAYSSQMEKIYINEISLYDENGKIIFCTDAKVVGSDNGHSEWFAWAKKKENRGRAFLLPLPLESQSLKFLLAFPLYQDVSDTIYFKPRGKFNGVLSFKLDLKEFLTHELRDSKTNLHQVWIMEKDGRLLFHSEHPEMVLRNIYQRDESCNHCHTSFDYAKKILKERHGTINYEVRNFPKKLAAYAPMEFENASWVVVVNSSYDEVTAFARKSLWEHLMLVGVVVLAFAAGSTLIVRNNQLKIKAEEEAKRWQEKIGERKKAEEVIQLERNNLKGILDNMQDGVSIVGQQCDIQYINPKIEKEFGPVHGRKCHEYFHDLKEVCSWCKNQEVLGGRPVQWEWYFPNNGKTYEISETPMMSPDGVVSKLEIFHDITARKRAEEALGELERQRRHLSFQLLMAQETERRRISRELHDELGGALAVLKLRLSFIERKLQEEQRELKEECQNNLQYIDRVMEDVHRLSRDLSPSILEDLGLSATLRWLINNFGKNYDIKMISDVADIDHLFRQSTQIVVYRIVQEALTNIGKHAQAKNVSLAVKRDDGMISISVEDDGKGFDVRKAIMKDAHEKGLGLASMDERARMLGGSLEVWSEEGKGSRITVSIPMDKKGSL
jgi:PAS domain S-box-containing protein